MENFANTAVGCYQLVSEIEENSFISINTQTNSTVMIKKLAKQNVDKVKAQSLMEIGHESLVSLLDIVEERQHTYLVYEYYPNTLKSLVEKSRTALSEAEAKTLVKQLVAACKELHANKLMHLNIGPQSIFIDKETNRLKLGEYELRYKVATNEMMYLAPEMFSSASYDYKADIWPLGVVAYFMLHGKHPFENPYALDTYFAKLEITDQCIDFLASCLQYESVARASCEELAGHPFLTLEASEENQRPKFDGNGMVLLKTDSKLSLVPERIELKEGTKEIISAADRKLSQQHRAHLHLQM